MSPALIEQIDTLQEVVSDMLTGAGLTSDFTLRPLAGGRNNRVYAVEVWDDAFLLKQYFRHPGDARDRLDTEFRFATFAWKRDLPVPQPLARDDRSSMGLYRMISGRPATGADITPHRIDDAIDFVNGLNEPTNGKPQLPTASDACLAMVEHLTRIDNRVRRLLTIRPSSDLDRELLALAQGQLAPMWRQVEASIQGRRGSSDADSDNRCVSPSDFGFHNAMIGLDDQTYFIDFEYAGWDGPEKLICDFFTQVAVPVPRGYLDVFLDRFVSVQDDRSRHEERVRLLLPAYRVKWCCIVLNDFLSVSADRRRFAQGLDDRDCVKRTQLDTARVLLEAIQSGDSKV